MYVYFKITNGDLSQLPNSTLYVGEKYQLFGEKIIKNDGCGYFIEAGDDPELFAQNIELKDFFLKATIRIYPDFQILHGPTISSRDRSYGQYVLGHAVAELLPNFTTGNGKERPYVLKIETTNWDGLSDMKKLEQAIWAGTIVPVMSYDREQRKIHLLDVLKQLLLTRKLSWIQRFFLSMRMLTR